MNRKRTTNPTDDLVVISFHRIKLSAPNGESVSAFLREKRICCRTQRGAFNLHVPPVVKSPLRPRARQPQAFITASSARFMEDVELEKLRLRSKQLKSGGGGTSRMGTGNNAPAMRSRSTASLGASELALPHELRACCTAFALPLTQPMAPPGHRP